MYSAYKLNKQGDNIQPWHIPFPILKQSVVPCLVLTITFWPAYSFLRKQVRWSGIPISQIIFQFVVIHTIKGFSVVKEAEVDGILLLFQWSSWCWQLISGSFAFSKSRLSIWKFSVHTVLKHRLEDFEHALASIWNECNCAVVWAFFGTALLWNWNENWSFPVVYGHCWVFQICWHIEYNTLTASSFRIWNSSSGIPSPLLALSIVMLPKAHLISDSTMSGSRWVITLLQLSVSLRYFFV